MLSSLPNSAGCLPPRMPTCRCGRMGNTAKPSRSSAITVNVAREPALATYRWQRLRTRGQRGISEAIALHCLSEAKWAQSVSELHLQIAHRRHGLTKWRIRKQDQGVLACASNAALGARAFAALPKSGRALDLSGRKARTARGFQDRPFAPDIRLVRRVVDKETCPAVPDLAAPCSLP